MEYGISKDTLRILKNKGHTLVQVSVDEAMSTMLNSVMTREGKYYAAGTQRVDGCGGTLSMDGNFIFDGIYQVAKYDMQ